jgi:transposase
MAKASEWRRRIAEWRASGLSAAKFAESRGCSVHQVWNWAAKFRKEDVARTAEMAGAAQPRPVAAHSIPLARVLRAPRQEFAEKPASAPGAMAVEVGGMRLVVPSGFDRGTLAMVLDEVEARKSGLGAR